MTATATATPVGELRAALITSDRGDELFEVFCHPFTAGETVAQSRLGALRVNGRRAVASVVDRLGNGDYIVRIQLGDELERDAEQDGVRVLELVA